MKWIKCAIFLTSASLSFAQTPKDTVTLSEILFEAASYEDSVFVYTNCFIKSERRTIKGGQFVSAVELMIEDIITNPKKYLNLKLDTANRLVINSRLTLFDFETDGRIFIPNIHFKKRVFVSLDEEEDLDISSSFFDDAIQVSMRDMAGVSFWKSKFKGNVKIHSDDKTSDSYIKIDGCSFYSYTENIPKDDEVIKSTEKRKSLESFMVNDTLYGPSLDIHTFGNLNLFNNSFELHSPLHRGISIGGQINELVLSDNQFNCWIEVYATVNKLLDFSSNYGEYEIDFQDAIYSGANVQIDWDQIDSLVIAEKVLIEANVFHKNGLPLKRLNLSATYNGSYFNEHLQKEYDRLVSTFRKLHQVYRNNGNERYANSVYIALKEIETTRLEYLAKNNGTFKNWTEWRLNQLLSVYTVYGTDPSGAIVGSFYIIILFGVFYFFYPSEWDTKSKKQLINDFKVFIEKNEYGYFKPFLFLSKGFVISLVNALTLSLNAFVTLGFGTIPTTGLARHVCIIQGFIGWFLLSIFTVSLINQVLF